jgi:type II secretory pathway component PulK
MKHRAARLSSGFSTRAAADRGGAVLIVALVCLTVAMLIALQSFKTAMIEQREFRNQQNRLQADWLAEAALDRAAARLAADAGYRGETWRIAAAELGGASDGSVLIRLEPVAGSARFSLSVQADCPADGDHRARRSQSLVIERPTTGEKS